MVSSFALFQQYANAMKQASAKKRSLARTYPTSITSHNRWSPLTATPHHPKNPHHPTPKDTSVKNIFLRTKTSRRSSSLCKHEKGPIHEQPKSNNHGQLIRSLSAVRQRNEASQRQKAQPRPNLLQPQSPRTTGGRRSQQHRTILLKTPITPSPHNVTPFVTKNIEEKSASRWSVKPERRGRVSTASPIQKEPMTVLEAALRSEVFNMNTVDQTNRGFVHHRSLMWFCTLNLFMADCGPRQVRQTSAASAPIAWTANIFEDHPPWARFGRRRSANRSLLKT